MFFSDSLQINGDFAGDVVTLVDNSIAFSVVPEPSALALLGLTAVLVFRSGMMRR
ncbi:MAG: PEP-CTERM sorting domain-containing protein [Verrucomicrobiae bacterium]|nr:PEP-CTERM sorting domain-containing protein [Verrucomicrobiae bacterium]